MSAEHLVNANSKAMLKLLSGVASGNFSPQDAVDVMNDWPAKGMGDAQMADERSQFDECTRCGHQYQNHVGLDGTRCNADQPCSCSEFAVPPDIRAALWGE